MNTIELYKILIAKRAAQKQAFAASKKIVGQTILVQNVPGPSINYSHNCLSSPMRPAYSDTVSASTTITQCLQWLNDVAQDVYIHSNGQFGLVTEGTEIHLSGYLVMSHGGEVTIQL